MAETISQRATGDIASAYEAGNEADFERLYQASYGKILGTLTAMLGDRAAAEDCAQDAFARAYKKWPTWQPIAPAEAWVHRIAINAAVSYQRKMRLREVGEVIRRIGRPGLAPDPQELVEHRDLAAALAKLPPKQAAAIVLRHYHGYTNRAIAQALGIPERTVASRLAVAKERLRVMLKHSYGPEAGIAEASGQPGLVAAAVRAVSARQPSPQTRPRAHSRRASGQSPSASSLTRVEGVLYSMAALLIILFATVGLAIRAVAYSRQWSAADSESAPETGFIDTCARTFILVLLSLLGLLALGLMYGNVLGAANASS